jgi:hypothetical protein
MNVAQAKIKLWEYNNGVTGSTATLDGDRIVEINGSAVFAEEAMALNDEDAIAFANQQETTSKIDKLYKKYSVEVATLAELLASIGLQFPCTEKEVAKTILSIPTGQRPTGLIGDFREVYRACRDGMTDAEIVGVGQRILIDGVYTGPEEPEEPIPFI